MLNRKKQILFAGLALLIVFAFVYATRERDPVYKGRRLSEYLREVHGIGLGWGGMDRIEPGIVHADTRNMEASEAVLNVGTNALPMLVRLLGTRESRAKLWLRRLGEKHPVFKRLAPSGPDTVFQRNMSALLAFYRLGPQATDAIPKIIPMLEDPDSAAVATVALMYIRPQREQDILSLTNVFRLRTPYPGASPEMLQCMAILALSTFGTNASGAIPLLMQRLGSTNGEVAAASAVALARIGGPPDSVVPIILENLPRSNASPRTAMISPSALQQRQIQRLMNDRNIIKNVFALGEYGRHASQALSRLLTLESYPDADIQQAARKAAAKIKGNTNSVQR